MSKRGDRSTLDLAVRATATLASRYFRERRTASGSSPSAASSAGLHAGDGLTQRYRIVDALLESEVVFNYA